MRTIVLFLGAVLFLASCELFEDDDNGNSSSSLGGDTDIELNMVGNVFTGSLRIGDDYIETNENVTITKNDDGVLTIKIQCALPDTLPLVNLIPDNLKDENGNLDFEARIKSTSEGLLDYTNADGKPFVGVRYNAKVGDTYVMEKSNGTKITRTVTAKSTTDDYPYGFYLIKTVTVEQDSRIPGVQKIIYNANHKFGLVGVDIVMEDRSIIHLTIFSPVDM